MAIRRANMEKLAEERDRRYEQRFGDQERAVAAALAAAEKAVIKAEAAADKRFEGVNEFRETLADQARSFVTRDEMVALLKSITEKVEDSRTRILNMETAALTKSNTNSTFIAAGFAIIGFVIAIAGVAVALFS